MQNRNKRLLFLNSIDPNIQEQKFAHISIHSIPLIKTVEKKFNLSDLNTNTSWVITSRKAAKIVSKIPTPKKIYVVGERTATYFKNALFPKISTAIELAKLIESENEKEVIFICGNQRRIELPKYLENCNIKVKEVVVYNTELIDKTVNLLDYDALAFMSPSSVKAMAKNSGFGNLPCFAIGTTTAKALFENNKKCIISSKPSAVSLIQAAQDFFN